MLQLARAYTRLQHALTQDGFDEQMSLRFSLSLPGELLVPGLPADAEQLATTRNR